MKRIKSKINSWYYNTKYFFESFVFLKAYFSPFKPPRVKFYFGDIKIGVPYFYPRKSVKFTKQDCIEYYNKELDRYKNLKWDIPKGLSPDSFKDYLKFVPIKYFGFNYCRLGWKTKWTNTDYRFEWNPIYSFVLFKKQLAILIIPVEHHHYWESWLYYNYSTDKSKSTVERLKDCMKEFPNTWVSYKDDKETKINYYSIILKKKYLKYIDYEKT